MDPNATPQAGTAPADAGLATAYCPKCSAAVEHGVQLPWPPGPVQCVACEQWIGRNRAVETPPPSPADDTRRKRRARAPQRPPARHVRDEAARPARDLRPEPKPPRPTAHREPKPARPGRNVGPEQRAAALRRATELRRAAERRRAAALRQPAAPVEPAPVQPAAPVEPAAPVAPAAARPRPAAVRAARAWKSLRPVAGRLLRLRSRRPGADGTSRPKPPLPLRLGGATMIAVGLLILAYGTVTVLWQDPITALTAARAQDRATAELDDMLHGMQPVAAKAETRARIARKAAALNLETPPGHALGRINIPKLDARFTVVQGTDEASLENGPGHYIETPLPGARGNWTVGIAGHRTTYLAPFRNVDQLEPGDTVLLRMPYARFRYDVTETQIVDPGEETILERKPYDQLALTACHPPFSATQRIIVYAKLRDVRPLGRS